MPVLPDAPFVVVIDPGHGGIDVGAVGKYSYEKDVALGVSLKLGKLIEQLPDVKVYYTRKTDMLPGGGNDKDAALHWRAKFANRVKGNLFISIHCNSAPRIRHRRRVGRHYRTYYTPNPARGTETYVWGVDKNSDKDLALRENGPLADDPEFKALLEGESSPEAAIMVNMMRHDVMRQSLDTAAKVETEFNKIGRVSREVKQRQVGIWVLQATGMPSVLVETGFISNPEEEDYLNHHQDEIANCIFQAFVKYLGDIRGIAPASLLKSPEQPGGAAAVYQGPQEKDVVYRIQLMASDTPYQPNDDRFRKLDGNIVTEPVKVHHDKMYRFLLGSFTNYAEASERLDKIKLMGFKDAFIVGYRDGKRLE